MPEYYRWEKAQEGRFLSSRPLKDLFCLLHSNLKQQPHRLTAAYTCTFDLSLYSRFSQLLQHLPFKFPLELTQSFPPQIWILQMKVLYVILSYWPSTVLGLPLLKTPSHQGTLSSFCKNSRMNTKKHLVSSCWQSSFGSMSDSGSPWTSSHWVCGRVYQNQDTKSTK